MLCHGVGTLERNMGRGSLEQLTVPRSHPRPVEGRGVLAGVALQLMVELSHFQVALRVNQMCVVVRGLKFDSQES